MNDTIPSRFGDYEVLELIEDNGGAQIYSARQTSVDRLVTLTVLPSHYADKAEFVKRFERQLAAASRLSHPNVVSAIDAGCLEGHQYIASEYAGGKTLSDSLDEKQWFPIRRCVTIGLDLARALEHLHEKRIVHRAVNPKAVLLAESGVAKLQGFSLSKLLEGDSTETWLDLDPYEARYMAPEQILFEGRTDARADIYGFGSVLYHLVTGQTPYGEGSAEEIRGRLARRRRPDPRELRGDVPEALHDVLTQCLQRDPATRYRSATQLVAGLETIPTGSDSSPRSEKSWSPLGMLAALFRNPE